MNFLRLNTSSNQLMRPWSCRKPKEDLAQTSGASDCASVRCLPDFTFIGEALVPPLLVLLEPLNVLTKKKEHGQSPSRAWLSGPQQGELVYRLDANKCPYKDQAMSSLDAATTWEMDSSCSCPVAASPAT